MIVKMFSLYRKIYLNDIARYCDKEYIFPHQGNNVRQLKKNMIGILLGFRHKYTPVFEKGVITTQWYSEMVIPVNVSHV